MGLSLTLGRSKEQPELDSTQGVCLQDLTKELQDLWAGQMWVSALDGLFQPAMQAPAS